MGAPDAPDADALKDLCVAACLAEERNNDLISGLIQAYVAALVEESEGADIATVSDGPSAERTWEAEKLYQKYVMAGYLVSVPEAKGADEEYLYECCTWYEFPSDIRWPPQLLAEVAYVQGYIDGRQAKAMAAYFRAEKARSA